MCNKHCSSASIVCPARAAIHMTLRMCRLPDLTLYHTWKETNKTSASSIKFAAMESVHSVSSKVPPKCELNLGCSLLNFSRKPNPIDYAILQHQTLQRSVSVPSNVYISLHSAAPDATGIQSQSKAPKWLFVQEMPPAEGESFHCLQVESTNTLPERLPETSVLSSSDH